MRTLPLTLCALLVVASPVMAAATENAAPAKAPIKVNRCDAEFHQGSPGGYSYAAYTPAYYPYAGRGYYWNDPYRRSYYQAPIQPSGTLYIDWVNTSPDEIKVVDFALVARSVTVAEVRDAGSFTQHAEIKHKFGVSPNIFPLGTSKPACAVTYVEYANGAKWTNPHLPPSDKALYEKHQQ